MLDPLSTLNAPPPRYLLESDSSDEEGQGAYPASDARNARPRRSDPVVTVRSVGSDGGSGLTSSSGPGTAPVAAAVVGIGQAGRFLLRHASARAPIFAIDVDGRPAGAGYPLGTGDGVLIALAEADEAGTVALGLVEKIIELVPASNWTLFSAYVPSMYIPDPTEDLHHNDPPVRSLTAGNKGISGRLVKPYDAPNYVTGIAGAFLSLAAHPASPLPKDVPVNLFVLPLPLSALAPTAVAEALGTLPAEVSRELTRPALWTEVDDEPFSGLGMGARRLSAAPATSASDFGGMYM